MRALTALRFITPILAFLTATTGVQASELYANDYAGPASLYGVNQATGALSLVGATGQVIGDLASGGGTGPLWGIDIPNNRLVTFNPLTGVGTAGANITGTAVPGGDTVPPIISLAANQRGGVFGNTSVLADFGGIYSDPSGDRLFSINSATGAATLLGAIGFNSVYALAFDMNGNLFGIAGRTLLSINTTTGAGTSIGTLLDATGAQVGTGFFDLAARPEDNKMFVSSAFSNELYTVDTSSAVLTRVGSYGLTANIVGLAFVSEVPEPSTYVLMLAGLLGLGFIARRRAAA
jgi:hypothetical protein